LIGPVSRLAERRQVCGGDPAGVNGARDERAVTAGVSHALEIQPGQNPSTSQQPQPRKPAAQRLEQAQVHTTPSPDPAEIQEQHRHDSRGGRLVRQGQHIGTGTPGVLHRRVQDWGAEPQIETEHDAGGANDLDHGGQIGKGVQCLEPDHDLAGTTGEHLQRTAGQAGAGIHHQRAGKAGMKLGELADQGALDGATLNRDENGYITFVDIEHRMEGAKQRHSIAHPFRDKP
jgi:hypothetical protein